MKGAWKAMDARLSERGCKVRWSNEERICFNVPDGACRWVYDGIELALLSLGSMEPIPTSKLLTELGIAQRIVDEARADGVKVDPKPTRPPAASPVVAAPRYDEDDPFAGIHD